MKRTILYLSILMSLLITACSNEDIITPASQEKGKECTFTFKVKIPKMASASRALTGNASQIKTFKCLVFDGNTKTYLYLRTATLGEVDEEGGEFTVNLETTDQPRIIHFVATHAETLDVPYQVNEFAVLSQLHVSGNDAYWQRKEYTDGITEGMSLSSEESPIIMVRNVARITLTSITSDFVIAGFAIVNAPSHGSVAPYYIQPDSEGNYFPEYITSATVNDTPSAENAYSQLINGNYIGVHINTASLSTVPNADNIPTDKLTDGRFVQYMYERTQESTPAFIVVKRNVGTAESPSYKYYKLDILRTNPTTGTDEYYKILRNFSYNLTITSVAENAVGYDSPEEAASAEVANNNLSVSAGLEDLTNIAYGKERLFVSKTEIVWTTSSNITFDFKYIDEDGNAANGEVAFYFRDPITEAGAVYDNTKTYSVTTGANGYSTISIPITSLVNKPNWKEQKVLVKGGTLSREVNLILIKPYEMTVVCYDGTTTTTDKVVDEAINKKVNVQITLPEGLRESVFPLTFYVEAEKRTLYPDATASNNNLPVVTDRASLFDGGNTFGYKKEITWDMYYNASSPNYTTVFTCNMLTNTATNASRVRVYNEYFSIAEDFFANGTFTFGKMTINGTTPNDDTEITIHYHVDGSVLGTVTYAQLKTGVTLPIWVDTSNINVDFCYFTYKMNDVQYRTQGTLQVSQAQSGATLNSSIVE